MTRPIVTEHNSQTDEVISREMNDVELAQYEAGQARAALRAIATAAAEATKAVAIAKLEALGLTVEDLSALGLGG